MTEILPVKVEWVDSEVLHGWRSADDLHADPPALGPCVTYGFLVEDLPDRVVIGQSFSSDTREISNLIVIPRVALVGMWDMRESRRRITVRISEELTA